MSSVSTWPMNAYIPLLAATAAPYKPAGGPNSLFPVKNASSAPKKSEQSRPQARRPFVLAEQCE
jgi:hypothetical protein